MLSLKTTSTEYSNEEERKKHRDIILEDFSSLFGILCFSSRVKSNSLRIFFEEEEKERRISFSFHLLHRSICFVERIVTNSDYGLCFVFFSFRRKKFKFQGEEQIKKNE